MGVNVDDAGALLLDGEVVAVSMSDATVARVAQCVSGAVLEGGLGLGQTRAALMDAEHVTSVQTVEIEQGIVDFHADVVPTVTTADVRDVIAGAHAEAWDSALLDLPPDVYDDAFKASLAEKFNWFGARVVVLSEDNSIQLPGFSRVQVEATTDGRYILIFDRFDPDNGVGERGGYSHFEPGRGWIPKEEA